MDIFPLKIVIFHSYVSLPAGKPKAIPAPNFQAATSSSNR
jgi:hypothetical protein